MNITDLELDNRNANKGKNARIDHFLFLLS